MILDHAIIMLTKRFITSEASHGLQKCAKMRLK